MCGKNVNAPLMQAFLDDGDGGDFGDDDSYSFHFWQRATSIIVKI